MAENSYLPEKQRSAEQFHLQQERSCLRPCCEGILDWSLLARAKADRCTMGSKGEKKEKKVILGLRIRSSKTTIQTPTNKYNK